MEQTVTSVAELSDAFNRVVKLGRHAPATEADPLAALHEEIKLLRASTRRLEEQVRSLRGIIG